MLGQRYPACWNPVGMRPFSVIAANQPSHRMLACLTTDIGRWPHPSDLFRNPLADRR